MENDTELLFPPRVIAALRDARGAAWQSVVDQVVAAGEGSVAEVAFVLMMARLNGCLSCNADSFRAVNGCRQCSSRNLRRVRETDADLVVMFAESQDEARTFTESPVLLEP
jgi:ribosomal protein L40E